MLRGIGVKVNLPDGPQIYNKHPVFVLGHAAYKIEKCRHCFANIAMVPTQSGKLQPHDADGQVHFATCAVLQERRKRKKEKPPNQMKLC
jgi:hypothetical protein